MGPTQVDSETKKLVIGRLIKNKNKIPNTPSHLSLGEYRYYSVKLGKDSSRDSFSFGQFQY